MTKASMQSIVGKAVTDSAFREGLFADPDAALAGYELDAVEIAALRTIDFETMEFVAGALEDRISKSFMLGAQPGLAQGDTSADLPAATAADASR